jgi:hypothetical protein
MCDVDMLAPPEAGSWIGADGAALPWMKRRMLFSAISNTSAFTYFFNAFIIVCSPVMVATGVICGPPLLNNSLIFPDQVIYFMCFSISSSFKPLRTLEKFERE